MSEATLSPSHEAAELGDNGAGGVRHKRILLVEGDGFTRLVLLLRLRLAGFNVDFTSNGMLGLGKLRSCQPDILLVELKLYGMSGLDLIKAARAEPSFGDRPIYVFTHADRMNRATRKEVTQLATKVFDKSSTTREDLVQTFASIFRSQEAAVEVRQSNGSPESTTRTPSETVPPEAIQEIVAGVQEQSERLARERDDRVGCGGELLSRVCSLTSCASAAGLPNLARQAKALENFLVQLCRNNAYKEPALRTISRSVAAMGPMCSERNGTESGLRKFSALVIDEAPDSNRALQEALRDAAFEPRCFSDPARAGVPGLQSDRSY